MKLKKQQQSSYKQDKFKKHHPQQINNIKPINSYNNKKETLTNYWKMGIGIGALALSEVSIPVGIAAIATSIASNYIADKSGIEQFKYIPLAIQGFTPAAIATDFAVKSIQNLPSQILDNLENNTLSDRRQNKIQLLLDASYKSQHEADKSLKTLGLTRDKDLSTMETKVYYSDNNKAYILHRGSVTAEDWKNNALIAIGLGKTTRRYKNASNITNLANLKYRTTTSVGHSQGGYYAEKINNTGTKITLNKASGINELFSKISDKETDIHKTFDLVSLPSMYTQTGGKRIRINSNSLNIFSAHNTSLN